MVVSGKRRGWWMIALLPILVLFAHRFLRGPAHDMQVIDGPQLVEAVQANFLHADDYVVGVQFEDAAYAFPYCVLYNAPAVLFGERGNRAILLWSPYANCATAFTVDRDLRAGGIWKRFLRRPTRCCCTTRASGNSSMRSRHKLLTGKFPPVFASR